MRNNKFLFSLSFVLIFWDVEAQTSCVTPNRESAKCIPINQCQILYDAVVTDNPEVVKFLRASQCGFSGQPLVCCGTSANYVSESTSRSILVKRPDLLPTNCGLQDNTKILNGQNTAPEEFPWTALLNYRNSSGVEQFSCGASLISDRYVVTAAHCVLGRILRVIGSLKNVRLGEWNTETDPDCFGNPGFQVCTDTPLDVGVEEVIPHPDYSDTSKDRYHDIALIRLSRAVKFTDYIKPVCVPKSTDQVTIGQKLQVVGWGKTETGRYSAIKQKLSVPVVEDMQCKRVFTRAGVNVRGNQLCAGGEKDKDSCNGDSGGPLLGYRNEKYYLDGVVSFGATCGREGWPGIYTRVSQYRDWIEGNIRP